MAKAKPGVSTQNLSSSHLKHGGVKPLPHKPPKLERKEKSVKEEHKIERGPDVKPRNKLDRRS
jgi:hypothetical protein